MCDFFLVEHDGPILGMFFLWVTASELGPSAPSSWEAASQARYNFAQANAEVDGTHLFRRPPRVLHFGRRAGIYMSKPLRGHLQEDPKPSEMLYVDPDVALTQFASCITLRQQMARSRLSWTVSCSVNLVLWLIGSRSDCPTYKHVR